MRSDVFVAGVGIALAGVCACGDRRDVAGPTATLIGSGRLSTVERPIQGVREVVVTAAGQFVIEQTGVETLRITADDNILPFVRAEVTDGRLVLGLVSGQSVTLTRAIEYRLTVARLDEVEASGAGQVDVRRLATDRFVVRLSGASTLTAAGDATRVELDVSGASRVRAEALGSRIAGATVSGASYALVRASESLTADVSGVSMLEYMGNPIVTSNLSGGGIVRRVGP